MDGAVEAVVECEAAAESWVVVDLPREKDPEVLEKIGEMGDAVSLTGEVGESRSREPAESFVLFFFKNDPRVGIRTACRNAPSPGLTGEPADVSGVQCRRRGMRGAGGVQQQW